MRHCGSCRQLGDLCPSCEDRAEERGYDRAVDDASDSRGSLAERRYERQIYGD